MGRFHGLFIHMLLQYFQGFYEAQLYFQLYKALHFLYTMILCVNFLLYFLCFDALIILFAETNTFYEYCNVHCIILRKSFKYSLHLFILYISKLLVMK